MTTDRYIHIAKQNATIPICLSSCPFGKPTERPSLPSLQACSGGCHKALEISSAATPDPPPNRKRRRQDCFLEVRGPNNRDQSGANSGSTNGRTTSRTFHSVALPPTDLQVHCALVVSEPKREDGLAKSKAAVPNHFKQRSKSHPFLATSRAAVSVSLQLVRASVRTNTPGVREEGWNGAVARCTASLHN
jgi:hypothetical protein